MQDQSATAPITSIGEQQPRLFRIYNHYRLLVSLILAGLLLVDIDVAGTGYRMPASYQSLVVAYLALNAFTALVMVAGNRPQPRHVNISILIDIIVLHGLLLFSSGITGGLANLVIISVAAGNILTPGRTGVFYAALATLGSLGIATWAIWTYDADVESVVRAGSLGVLYFASAFLLQHVSRRLIRSEALASSRAQSIAELEQINQQVIHRMLTGIVVASPDGRIRTANAAAHELLTGTDSPQAHLERLPTPVLHRLTDWLDDPEARSKPFQIATASPLLQTNFSRLGVHKDDLILVFIEDLSRITQQAQQMKLASLGRLTGGIAHQIRNPLGAISHAAQLLEESPNLDDGDRKMTGIIQRHCKRVNNIIESILDLSRRRESQVQMMDPGEWLEGFVADYRHNVTREGRPEPMIDLEKEADIPPARFDPGQLEQVLINLCENGLRYSEMEIGEPRLKIQVGVTQDGDRCRIDIQDHGPGLDDDQKNHLFEPFFTTSQGGTGLGLYLARELCEANQAHLGLVDNGQPGCCFRITFAHQDRLI